MENLQIKEPHCCIKSDSKQQFWNLKHFLLMKSLKNLFHGKKSKKTSKLLNSISKNNGILKLDGPSKDIDNLLNKIKVRSKLKEILTERTKESVKEIKQTKDVHNKSLKKDQSLPKLISKTKNKVINNKPRSKSIEGIKVCYVNPNIILPPIKNNEINYWDYRFKIHKKPFY